MQQRASHRVYWDEYRGRYHIEVIQGRITSWPGIILDTWEWFAWLQRVPSFAFQSRDGSHFTARKETRARGGVYWIAYRHIGGQLVKRYIGVPAAVTIARLEEIASELETRAAPEP